MAVDDIDFGTDTKLEDPNAPVPANNPTVPPAVEPVLETIVNPKGDDVAEPNNVVPPVEVKEEEPKQVFAHGYDKGTVIEFDNKDYTVNDNGDLVDETGTVFKKVDEIKSFMDENSVVDENAINLNSVIEKLGVDIVDDGGKPVTFTNDLDGVSAYIESVITSKESSIAQSAVESLFSSYPELKVAHDYMIINGTLDGYNETPDRTGWTLEEKNDLQHEHIIRMDYKEAGRDVDADYISYLKDSGKLYEQAQKSLDNLQKKDVAYKEALEKEAEQTIRENAKNEEAYWSKVTDRIHTRNIAGFKIPETFKITKDGKESVVTPNDFLKYISVAGKDGTTQYTRDLSAIDSAKRESEQLDRDLLDAYLHFTGGKYSDLVKHFVKAEEVKRITLQARTKSKSTAKVVNTNTNNTSNDNILFD